MEATLTVRLTVRPLVEGDLQKDFVPLLQQLSTAVAVDPLFYKCVAHSTHRERERDRERERERERGRGGGC
jgi:hypothetical protein